MKNSDISPAVGLTRSSAVRADFISRNLLDLPQRSGCRLAQRHFSPDLCFCGGVGDVRAGPHRAAARIKACSTWLCWAGRSAQVAGLRPGGGGTQARLLSSPGRVMVVADHLVASGPDGSHRRLERRTAPLKEVKSWGCPNFLFRIILR